MNKVLVILLTLAFFVHADDTVVLKLKAENQLLKSQIEKNNEMIKLRESSQVDIKRLDKEAGSFSLLSLGVDYYYWGADLTTNASALDHQVMTASYAYFKNNIGGTFSFGRVVADNYPSNGISTLIMPVKAELTYRYSFWENLSLLPSIGYVRYLVSSPNAGESGDPVVDEYENSVIDQIEDNSGAIFSLALARKISSNWLASIRVERGRASTTGLRVGYVF